MSTTRTHTRTRINIDVTETRTNPGRKRVSFPEDDLVTMNWWDAQVSPSASVRLLILAEAAKHGIVDRITRTGATPAPASAPKPNGATTAVDPRDEEIATLKIELGELRASLASLLATSDASV